MKFPSGAIALALSFAATLPAAAADDPWNAPFTLQVGLLNARASTSARLDSDAGRSGTQISYEGDFGMTKTKALPSLDFTWRMAERHALEATLLTLHRDGERTISGQINWGEITFPVNTTVHSTFDSDILRLAYRYSPIRDDNVELGLLLGLHYTKLSTTLSSAAGNSSQEASVDYPLPTIGIRGLMRVAPNWRLSGFAQLLKIKIGDYDGELYNFFGGVDWGISRNAIVGLGYDYYKYNLVSTKSHARGEFDYTFQGPKLYFSWGFQ